MFRAVYQQSMFVRVSKSKKIVVRVDNNTFKLDAEYSKNKLHKFLSITLKVFLLQDITDQSWFIIMFQ